MCHPPPRGPLAAHATGATTIDVSWLDLSSNETEFRIERKEGAGGSFSHVGTQPPKCHVLFRFGPFTRRDVFLPGHRMSYHELFGTLRRSERDDHRHSSRRPRRAYRP